ncbi:hypothetical protein SERLA73DRAFT_142532 [Serpula lacrymans var. lacrymans S7.3]|uniref:Uncharacterized protein n=2 Tax=Serpula lacrymans var. lacrymans TaxID=341189 RepID=F8Q7X8_SERL3|nr:uncharacterized protein SERLADRAFT_398663 [Serpula lacrymans var. lacrymans S7.9]EGN95666.1 hypothetical protein SERLA73DRAFT_142532 [Serpula lacrymans var. lacrymans S7.3]EGO21193.1 hypothetical protein SERLADRAFT_398663 [Serpula lacrymans var. lacrymans S7.9]
MFANWQDAWKSDTNDITTLVEKMQRITRRALRGSLTFQRRRTGNATKIESEMQSAETSDMIIGFNKRQPICQRQNRPQRYAFCTTKDAHITTKSAMIPMAMY